MLSKIRYMNPYQIHVAVINQYILKKPGDTDFLKRDTSKDKRDFDVIRENHQFLWDESTPETWETKLAKKYYDKLFKEYCICDLILYKENKVAMRWRTDQEVIKGKGQFICGNKRCNIEEELRSWEVNFGYIEKGEKKNALVKLRLCPTCSLKLNYHSKKREIKRLKTGSKSKDKNTKKSKEKEDKTKPETPERQTESSSEPTTSRIVEPSPWAVKPTEEKSREQEFEEYLEDLLL